MNVTYSPSIVSNTMIILIIAVALIFFDAQVFFDYSAYCSDHLPCYLGLIKLSLQAFQLISCVAGDLYLNLIYLRAQDLNLNSSIELHYFNVYCPHSTNDYGIDLHDVTFPP